MRLFEDTGYFIVPTHDGHDVLPIDEKQSLPRSSPQASTHFLLYMARAVALVVGLSVTATVVAYAGNFLMPITLSGCEEPQVRREWRGLTRSEQQNFIQAVRCLEDFPSEIVGRGTFYDDLVYMHSHVGSRSHSSASFLPWHRASIHIFEMILTERCGLTIPLPYWDWGLDHQALEASSIWSAETGFGGDGGLKLDEGLAFGRCVTDGPFANVTRLHWDNEEQPHCLGRSFFHYEREEMGKISGSWFTPERLGILRRMDTYALFEDRIEKTLHNGLHWSVRGDFSSMTSANDPLFWLHHAQLDRIWWQWQLDKPNVRLTEYKGASFNTSEGREREASLQDELEFLGLSRTMTVFEVMNTQSNVLCYRY